MHVVNRNRSRARRGMTLVEVLAVVVILGLIAGTLLVGMSGTLGHPMRISSGFIAMLVILKKSAGSAGSVAAKNSSKSLTPSESESCPGGG